MNEELNITEAVKCGVRNNDFKTLERRLNVPKAQDPAKEKLQEILNLYSGGQLQQTLNQTLELITDFPKSSILYNICGVANAGLGQLDSAIISYEKAIEIKPNYADAYNNLGNTLRKQGKLDQALEVQKGAPVDFLSFFQQIKGDNTPFTILFNRNSFVK